MGDGGCITKSWSSTLQVSERIIDLVSARHELMREFERLHDKHARQLPRFMRWGAESSTSMTLAPGISATIRTVCSRSRGLHSSCSLQSKTRSR